MVLTFFCFGSDDCISEFTVGAAVALFSDCPDCSDCSSCSECSGCPGCSDCSEILSLS